MAETVSNVASTAAASVTGKDTRDERARRLAAQKQASAAAAQRRAAAVATQKRGAARTAAKAREAAAKNVAAAKKSKKARVAALKSKEASLAIQKGLRTATVDNARKRKIAQLRTSRRSTTAQARGISGNIFAGLGRSAGVDTIGKLG